MSELSDRVDTAIEELGEWMLEHPGDDPDEVIFEIADGSVPVYTSDILQCALDNLYLSTEEPELGPAFDGSPTPTNIIAANIFQHIVEALWEYYRDNKDNFVEDDIETEELEE